MSKKRKWLPLGMATVTILFNLTIWAFAATDDRAQLSSQNQKATRLTGKPTSGETYGFYGDLEVINNGEDGGRTEIELEGWLVGYDEGGEEAE